MQLKTLRQLITQLFLLDTANISINGFPINQLESVHILMKHTPNQHHFCPQTIGCLSKSPFPSIVIVIAQSTSQFRRKWDANSTGPLCLCDAS